MLVNQTHTQNFSGISAVNVKEGTGEPVLYMNASVDQNKNISFSEQIRNVDLYAKNKKEVDKDLKQNIFNCRTGLYKQLAEKVLFMGYTSLSDLCSNDFMNFRRDKENIISDGEIKYKKYINKILEKIKKVERYVDDYKRKEDKIIKDLENLYNDAVIEERKNKQKMKEKNMKNNNDKTNKINDISKLKRKTVTPFQIIKETKTLNCFTSIMTRHNDDTISIYFF
jgi:hypothetical protein